MFFGSIGNAILESDPVEAAASGRSASGQVQSEVWRFVTWPAAIFVIAALMVVGFVPKGLGIGEPERPGGLVCIGAQEIDIGDERARQAVIENLAHSIDVCASP
jgi:hypothetical protein